MTNRPLCHTEMVFALITQPRYDLWIFQSLRRIMRAVDLYSAKLVSNYEITSPQLICLLTLHNDGPLTTSALAKLVHLSNSTVVGILDRLEKRGLIHRERGREDRRLVLVSITSQVPLNPGRRMKLSPARTVLASPFSCVMTETPSRMRQYSHSS